VVAHFIADQFDGFIVTEKAAIGMWRRRRYGLGLGARSSSHRSRLSASVPAAPGTMRYAVLPLVAQPSYVLSRLLPRV
jgi:hypothetical protein